MRHMGLRLEGFGPCTRRRGHVDFDIHRPPGPARCSGCAGLGPEAPEFDICRVRVPRGGPTA